jgi:Cdc6-like AAA superfamily ATPase
MVTLNEQQEEAIKLIKEWYYNSSDLVFTLSGSAGTGKTFLINYLIENVISLRDD